MEQEIENLLKAESGQLEKLRTIVKKTIEEVEGIIVDSVKKNKIVSLKTYQLLKIYCIHQRKF